jgi:ABC-type nitrate/sulfonate/bicarbonate transport system substrate-binding protein
MALNKRSIYYARCPVPTASGIALHRGMFEQQFAGSDISVANIGESGPAHVNAHFTHDLDNFIREGGCTPPIWARSRGASTRLLGITFMREPLGVYVRTDDDIETVTDLAGLRLALPVWPQLVFNFWRVAAHKGFQSALDAHGMRESEVKFVDVTEDKDPHRRLNLAVGESAGKDDKSEYDDQLQALLCGNVDAIFAKGAESTILVRQSRGAIRLLYDVNQSSEVRHQINNSTPRLLTCSEELLEEHGGDVETYLSAIVRAARWAENNPQELRIFVASECGIRVEDIDLYFPSGYESDFLPVLSDEFIRHADAMKEFMLEQRYIENDFSIDEWAMNTPMEKALAATVGISADAEQPVAD